MRTSPSPSRVPSYSSLQLPSQQQAEPAAEGASDCRQVKIAPPYSERDIQQFREGEGIAKVGNSNFDSCAFQCALAIRFFKLVASDKLAPADAEYRRTAQYMLKKSLEMLGPLKDKAELAWLKFDHLVTSAQPASADAQELAPLVRQLRNQVLRLERDFLRAFANMGAYCPARDKQVYLGVIYTVLRDVARAVSDQVDVLSGDAPGPALSWQRLGQKERKLMEGLGDSDLFSSGELSDVDKANYAKVLNTYEGAREVAPHVVLCVSRTAEQGIVAIVDAMVNGCFLLSVATEEPMAVHADLYKRLHFKTFDHDCQHLCLTWDARILGGHAQEFKPIFDEIMRTPGEHPEDLVLLFYLLHENDKIFAESDPDRSFADYASEFATYYIIVRDFGPLLNGVGYSIARPETDGRASEKAAFGNAVATAINEIWTGFRERHGALLERTWLRATYPRWFV